MARGIFKLQNIAARLNELSEDLCIYGKKPWSITSEYILVPPTEDFRAPEAVLNQGYKYFLEIHVAKEVCEVFGQRHVDANKIANLLLFYAENDGFPSWVYDD